MIITPPAPAVPYLIPKNEDIINAVFKTELESTNFSDDLFKDSGCFIKNSMGKKEMLIRKKRQNTTTSSSRSYVRIFKALQPPPHKNIDRIKREIKCVFFILVLYRMSYIEWFDAHALKHKKIVKKLLDKNYTKEEIVDYFDFDNMVKMENDFCPLYKEGNKCHDMKELNCYLCACPNFRFSDDGIDVKDGKNIKSICDIDNGEEYDSGDVVHQNCSKCTVPHHKDYVLKNFSLDWREIMKNCHVT